ncbi:MAG: phage GP46 family protein [Pseudodesulfovibrio sp.]|nr:phage GP46 family protein [Pseudodesulfovibrio sp.]
MLKLIFKSSGGDLRLDADRLATASDLETAVVISLFTDQLAEHDEELPFGESDRRGWCLDHTLPKLPDGTPDRIGSKLWMLKREKLTPETVERYREYVVAALQWLIDEGAATSIEVKAERVGNTMIALSGRIIEADGPYDWAFNIDTETMQPERG